MEAKGNIGLMGEGTRRIWLSAAKSVMVWLGVAGASAQVCRLTGLTPAEAQEEAPSGGKANERAQFEQLFAFLRDEGALAFLAPTRGTGGTMGSKVPDG